MCFKGKQFLSLNFRRIFDIFLIECDYRTESNKIYAILKHSVVGGTEIKRCLVLTEALNVFLRTTSQLLLYGIRSHKYSERFLNKFGLRKSNKKYRFDRKNFIYNFRVITNQELDYRYREKSMSIVFGKYIFMNI